ncbi:hypothetical protein SASPL_111706 [Salvia splendens]|uniref:Ras-related protein Rab-18 n=1 Tax=Salvia splendens TaxID=180675 RepID=A0A8X8Y7C3_SALSN|nr:hypothetical protein SASPL_111706 [Salvia splendens]
MVSSGQGQSNYDLSFKILLIGDSTVGKSSLLVSFCKLLVNNCVGLIHQSIHSFISNVVDDLSPTVGVDFKIKFLTVGGKKLKLTIWDTAGQERFRTLTSSYYRGAHGIVHVYDVTRRDTFTNLSDVWAKELELYSTNEDWLLEIKLIGLESERVVSREEGMSLAKELGCLFLECSARTRENVEQCFAELALKIMDVHVPRLLEEGSTVKRNILKQKQEHQTPPSGGCCS